MSGAGPTGRGGVAWYPYASYDSKYAPEIFVSWRYRISTFLAARSPHTRRFLWLQDTFSRLQHQLVPRERAMTQAVFCLSHFHVKDLGTIAQLARVTPNALDPKFFVDGPNYSQRLIYASAPNRGLEQVLLQWRFIRSQLPDVTLHIYYGFTEAFLKFGQKSIPNFYNWLHSKT